MAQVTIVRPHHNNGGHNPATTLTIVAPRGQNFWLFIDDVLQNQNAVHSICIQNLRNDEYYVRVELDNQQHSCVGQYVDTRRAKTLSIVQNWKYYGVDDSQAYVRPDLTMNLVTGQPNFGGNGHPNFGGNGQPNFGGNGQPNMPPAPPMAFGMNQNDYEAARQTIARESFDDSKLDLAKQIISRNPMTVDQIVGICRLFSFESNKLEFAKFAYAFCVEKNKYFMLNDVFSYESSKRELNDYINGF